MSKLLKSSIISSLILLIVSFTFWDWADIVTLFLAPIILIGIWIAFIGLTVVTLWFVFLALAYKTESHAKQNLIGVCINVIVAIFVIVAPLNEWRAEMDFALNLKERMKVIALIQSGSLIENNEYPDCIDLPKEFKHVSKSGNVEIHRNKGKISVVFFTFLGILDNYSGFIYQSDGSEPNENELATKFLQVQKIDKNWYWIACT